MKSTPHEETYLDYEIYIDENPDPYREGLIWSVCRNNEELYEGLEFDFKDALQSAQRAAREHNEQNS